MSSDEQLAARGARGDTGAFEAIFRRYHQDLYRFCLAMVGNAEDAQDALQNTMVKVLRALPGEQRQIQLRPWLYRIARNESIETLRKRRDESGSEADQGSVAGPAETAETRARLRQLLDDLERLPQRQRTVLTMRELSGLSYAEIATAIESSEAAARQTLYEARLSLRQLERGREMRCESVMRELSDADGRVTRRREIQAHLQSCTDCRAFKHQIENRHRDLAALAPLPVAASTGLLNSVLAKQAGSAAGVAGGNTAGALAVGGGNAVATSAVVKSVATVAIVAAVGISAERGVVHFDGSDRGADMPAVSAPALPGKQRSDSNLALPSGKRSAAAQRSERGAPVGAAGDLQQPGRQRHTDSSPAGEAAAAAPPAEHQSASGAGVAPPGGGHGRSAAEGSGRPDALPTAADNGQETANAAKPAGAGKPANAGKPSDAGQSADAGKPAEAGRPESVGAPHAESAPPTVRRGPPSPGEPKASPPGGSPPETGKGAPSHGK